MLLTTRLIRRGNVSRTGKRWQISGCVLAASLVWAAVPRTAWAQSPPDDVAQARELFVEGSELRDQGDVRGALEKFKAAHALAVNPITAFELARTYEAVGMLEQARDLYASIAGIPVQPDETERAAAARRDGAKAAEELKSRVPPPAVVPTPPTMQVASPPEAPRVEPPPRLSLSFPTDAPQKAPEQGGNHFGPAAYAGFGIGATGFVVGTILAAATMSKASSIQCSNTSCEQSSEDAAHAARTLGFAAVISYTVGAAGVAVGVADLVLYKPGPTPPAVGLSVHPWIGAGAAGLRGSF